MKLFSFSKKSKEPETVPDASVVVAGEPEAKQGDKSADWQKQVPVSDGPIVSRGLFYVYGSLAVFFLLAVSLPISSAVIGMGLVVSNGQNKLIQHPTGGVVAGIFVKDGALVKKGDVMLSLNPASAKAELTRLTARQAVLQATKDRLVASDRPDVVTNSETFSLQGLQLRGASDTLGGDTTQSALQREQKKEQEASAKRLNADLDAIAFRIETLKEEGAGLLARLKGQEDLLAYSKLEIKKIKPLVDDGILAKSRLWELDKTRLEQESTIGNLKSEIAANRQRIAEAEAQYDRTEAADDETRSDELTEVLGELAQLGDQIEAARNSLELMELKAPVDGTIVRMAAHTIGGVIVPGDVVAELVPLDAGLGVEFRVMPNDIDAVRIGQKARINVTAFNNRTYDPIDGEVVQVDADSTVEPTTGERYFKARVKLTPDPNKVTGISELGPGMATEVFVLAKPRVFLAYLTGPIRDSFNRAFRQ